MKNFTVKSLLLSTFLLVVINSSSQVFLAGQHNSGNYYYDIDPDTTLIGPQVHGPYFPPATYPFDINNDGINDVYLYAWGSQSQGFNEKEVSIRINDTSASQVAFGDKFFCLSEQGDTLSFNTVKFLQKNDTIGNNLFWTNKVLYLSCQDWILHGHACYYNGFPNYSSGNYLAVRFIRPSDTIYGWIRVSNINDLTYTVEEFAFSNNSTGIDQQKIIAQVQPNPTNDMVMIETQLPGFNLVIYNQFGKLIIEKTLLSTKTEIDLRTYASGLYVFKICKDHSFHTRKIIKM